MQALEQLFYLYGIGYEYTKYTAEHVIFSHETRKAALEHCGINTNDAELISALNFSLDAANWLQLVPAVSIVSQQATCLKVRIENGAYSSENTLTVCIKELGISLNRVVGDLPVTGDYVIDDITYLEIALPLPIIPVGYHQAKVSLGLRSAETEIWLTPDKSYQVTEAKRTGLSIQLYSLKNKAGQGIGDFADLLALVKQCTTYNLDYILLNPLHLLFENEPMRASPYSPNSRALLNPLYIAINLSEDAKHNTALNEYLASDIHQDFLQQTEQQQYINYDTVSESKYQQLRLLYEHFCQYGCALRKQQFNHFCVHHQHTLATLTVTERQFAYYLQWQAHTQLKQCQQTSHEQGMVIGLINDLAVGCAVDGSEYLSQTDLFTLSAHVGAPPDPWAEQGQNWGLPALDPQKIRSDKFAYYRALIRANMENVGGLRIDHVMAIRRLWWCFENQGEQDGCYVYYPFEHLLAILKIESHLNECIVIGEDLGVVPPEVKDALSEGAIFSNSLFYFEKDSQGDFLNSEYFAAQSLLMVANHDVPPFFGWWQKKDIDTKLQYQLINDEQHNAFNDLRDIEKNRLLHFLSKENVNDFTINSSADVIYAALTIALAAAPACLFALQLDDLDKQTLPVNIPGTDTEYPNWRRVLSHSSEMILQQNADLLTAIKATRINT